MILLAAFIEKSQIVEALQLGARGVVLIGSAIQVLLKAIQSVMAGKYWVLRESFSNLSQYLPTPMQSMYEEVRQKFEVVRQKFGLTHQELDIVSAVFEDYSNKEIAEYLKIGEDTVKRHLSNIFDKVGVSSRLDLALFVVNRGLPLKGIEGQPAHSPLQTYNALPAMTEACPRCGSEFLLGSRFCHTCGKNRPEAISSSTSDDAAALAGLWERKLQSAIIGFPWINIKLLPRQIFLAFRASTLG